MKKNEIFEVLGGISIVMLFILAILLIWVDDKMLICKIIGSVIIASIFFNMGNRIMNKLK